MASSKLMVFLVGFGLITILFGIILIIVYKLDKPSVKNHQIPSCLSGKDVSYLQEEMLTGLPTENPLLKDRIIKK